MFGKREQIVALAIGVLATIFVVHILVFEPRARRYGEVYERFTQGTQALSGAKMPPGASYIPNYQKKTTEISAQVTSVVTELNLDVPPYYQKTDVENLLRRYEVIKALLRDLVQLRQSVRQPVLSFLDARPNPLNPNLPDGWNFPRELPRTSSQVALGDTLRKAIDRYTIMKSIADPIQQILARQDYNVLMDQIGARPIELSNYIATVQGRNIFFNDAKMAERLPGGAQALGGSAGGFGAPTVSGVSVQVNPFSLNRFGPFVPELKKLWLVSLIQDRLQAGDSIDPAQLTELFEITIIYDDTLLYVERQLRALIDIIRMAERNRIAEISQVKLMKPVDMAASRKRGDPEKPAAAATPTPAAASGLGSFFGNRPVVGAAGGQAVNLVPTVPPDQRVAVGTGIELVFRGSNAATVDFLFEIGTSPRTYVIDDLYITARPNNEVETSTTIELVTKLEAKR